MEVLQIPSELDRALKLRDKLKPRRILEIGCWDGGTLREWLNGKPPPELVVAISLEHNQPEVYPAWVQKPTQLVVGTGDSLSEVMVHLIQEHAPYDWAFIDGEHSYPYVSHDVAVVLPLLISGSVLLLHDVTPDQFGSVLGPLQVLQELAEAGRRVEVYDVPERYPWSAGIGVVYV